MRAAVRDASLLGQFLLELAVYASAGYWGLTVASGLAGQWLAGLGAPGLLILAWALFGSPRAPFPLRGHVRAGFEIAWFGAGAAALGAAGQLPLAVGLAAGRLADAVLLHVTADTPTLEGHS